MSIIAKLTAANAARWTRMSIKPASAAEFNSVAKRLCASKERYQHIADATGVPWFIVAVIHERESSGNFTEQLGQGDPLGHVSIHAPKGRGPFFNHPDDLPGQDAFYRAALDALIDCPPHAARNKDWSAGGSLTQLEQYNGLGYAERGISSPYIWSGTNQYVSGKYVSDGKFSATEVDEQLGCAGLLHAMMSFDNSIGFAS